MKRFSIVLVALLSCAVVLLSACSASVSISTANIRDLTMTTGVDADQKPVDSVTSYSPDASQFVVSCIIANAPEGTKVNFVWKKDDTAVFQAQVETPDSGDRYLASNLTNNGPWPTGKYGVDIYLDDQEKPAASITFSVE